MNTNNVVKINKNESFKFVVLSTWIDYIFHPNGKIDKLHLAIIAVKDTNLDIHVIHPVSQFIMDNWKNNKHNTQRKHANNLVRFLNYILVHGRHQKVANLSDLTIQHGTSYLDFLATLGLKKSTIKEHERTLTQFYHWLVKVNIINDITYNTFEKKETHFGSYIESPFNPVYPAQKPVEIEHTLPISYIPLLLEVAISVANPIALGLYFQIFGGLRISEVVNLKRTQVARRMQDGDFILNLQNQNFRSDLKEDSSVKKVRTQRVLEINNWGHILFRDHIKLYKPTDNSNALFINRDGKAMSQRSYRQYFQKVKDNFIALLENHGDSEQKLVAKHLKYMKWSTHIGRGTFTNLIAEDAENPYEIAHLRGDSNIDSSLTYMVSTERIHKKIENKFSNMHEGYIPNLINRNE